MKETIYELFAQSVAAHGQETAIIEGNRTMTFGELSGMVDTMAASFPPGVKSVGIVMSHRAEMIAAILAVLKCGACYVPAEPDFPAERIRFMMEEAAVDFVLTEQAHAGKLEGLPLRLTDCELCAAAAGDRQEQGEADTPAYVLYTCLLYTSRCV